MLNRILLASFLRLRFQTVLTTLLFVVAISTQPVSAADFSDAEKAFRSGDYATAEAIASAEVERGVWNEQWSKLLIR